MRNWTLTGPAVLQPLAALYCTGCFSWEHNTAALPWGDIPHLSSPRGGCFVPCVFTPSPFPLSHVEQLKDESKLWELIPLPAHSQRCAGTLRVLRATQLRGRGSAPLPGQAPSWWFLPITLMEWLIFKWHFHTVQAWSVCQSQKAFASSPCFAAALRGTFTGKAPQAAPGQGEHPTHSKDSSHMKQKLVKYFLYHHFLHLNLLTVNFWKPYGPR